MTDTRVCPGCGHANGLDARFCGRCGTSLAAVPVQHAAPTPAATNRTMLGALIDPSTATSPDPVPTARAIHRTVMGGGFDAEAQAALAQLAATRKHDAAPIARPASSTIGLPPSPMSTPGQQIADEVERAPAAPVAVAATSAVEASRPRQDMMRTMLGVGLEGAPASQPAAQPIAAQPIAAQPIAVQTAIVEQPAPVPNAFSTLVAPVPPPANSPSADTVIDPPQPKSPPARAVHRTMLGMQTPFVAPVARAPEAPASQAYVPVAPVAAAVPEASVATPAKRNIGPSNRTMLGVIAPVGVNAPAVVEAPPAGPSPNAYAPSTSTTSDMSIAGLPSPRRRVRGWFFALLAVGVLLVGSVIAAGIFYRVTRTRVDVVALVAPSATGEMLGVDVTRAPEGTRARFGSVETPLTGTHADFPLAADALHVGDNAVAIAVLFADGTTEMHTVTLTVEYRVRADLGTLSATPPAITVVIDAIPGSTVVLDAQPVMLDAAGHGARAYPLAAITPDASGAVSLTAHYTITPPAPAAAASGALSSRVPTTTLHLERPGDHATTDADSVDVSGVAQVGASVSVDGAAASVGADGHFTITTPLDAVGAHEVHVSASIAGRAPASAVIHIERVADLARAAATYSVDRTITYARLTSEGTANLQGQHVAIEGRVYNVDLQDGHGVLQMLARDCPASTRCPLWVTHSAITDVTVESWVRVIGTVAPDQHFVSQSGEVRTVPRVDAVFVLPSHP